jgi:hypothetical protein
MPTFTGQIDFTVGTATAPAPGGFAEDGISFTYSVTNTTGEAPTGTYNPAAGTLSVNEGTVRGSFTGASDGVLTWGLVVANPTVTHFGAGAFSIKAAAVSGTWKVLHEMGTVGTFKAGSLTVTGVSAGIGTQIKFINVSTSGTGANLKLDFFNGTIINCFLTGTHIATADGARAVESLQPGDRILTADGQETTVKWLGQQAIDARLTHPAKVNPICISAGALADNVPARDLYLTADHALEIDGLLINAGALVNGRSIYQVQNMPLDGFSYWHIETDAHQLILAEGCPAESYLDASWQGVFDNAAARTETTPIPEMELPRISTARLVPAAISARLLARAGEELEQRKAA